MGNWYKVSGQYDDGCKVYKKDYIVFAESSSAEQKIFHLKLPYDCSFFPCTVTQLIKNIIYEF